MKQLLRMHRAAPRRVLGLRPRDDAQTARKQYYKIVRLIHPDKCDVPGATAAFQIVQKAYEDVKYF